MKKTGWIIAVAVIAGIGMSGCGKKSSGGGASGGYGAMPPPAVRVLTTKLEAASPVEEYIAHVEPVQEVKLMAQVEGIIQQVHFQEGTRVKQGDLLFTIDPAPYKAKLAQRKAELEQAQASLDRVTKYLAMLNAADGRSVSKSDLDAAEANVAEGKAQVDNAKAALQQAEIDLGYTRITSPIDGRIGRALITKGNLVSPSSGPLATVIQVDPIRVVVALPDSDYMNEFERYTTETNFNPLIKIRLSNGKVLPQEGKIAFDDNQMDPSTGTMAIRLRFSNPNRMLVPNAYVHALVQDRGAPKRILVPVEAVMHGEQGAFVWVVKDDNSVVAAPIKTGAQIGERQIVESGLEPGQRVVYAGMQKVRPGATVSVVAAEKSE